MRDVKEKTNCGCGSDCNCACSCKDSTQNKIQPVRQNKAGKFVAIVDEAKCPAIQEHCKAIKACKFGAINYTQDDDLPLGGKIVIEQEKCKGCGECVSACCGGCINLVSYWR